MSSRQKREPGEPAPSKEQGDKYVRNSRRSGAGRVSWADADAASLLDAICSVTDSGDAIILSKTADGGALSITVISGANKHRWYPNSEVMIAEDLEEITELARG